MLETIRSLPSSTKTCFLVATAVAARNVLPAICCKIGSVALKHIDKRSAYEWRKSSNEYWTQAKKDAVRDLAIASGFILVGIGAVYSKEIITKIEGLNQQEEQPEEPQPYESYVDRIYDWVVNSKPNIQMPALPDISGKIQGLKDWAWQRRKDIGAGIGLLAIANHVRCKYQGDPLLKFIGSIREGSKWYLYGRPMYHREQNPNFR